MLARYLLGWFPLAAIGVANGILREATYADRMSELAAHQLSTATGILATGALVWWWSRVWPIPSAAFAWLIGACWLIATVLFEFGFGHYVAGHAWRALLADYNLVDGRVWALFLAWIAVSPYLFYRLGRSGRG